MLSMTLSTALFSLLLFILYRSDLTRAYSATKMQIETVKHADLHISKPTWWLESRFHFSFADWHDSSRLGFGALRVVNDDLVKGHAGFGAHPHRDMEIFSYILDGELSHADSMGNKESLPRGCVQYMSAGTGIYHAEMNDGADTCRFMQIWIKPDKHGHTPQYGSSRYAKEDRHNRLLQILGGTRAAPAWKDAHDPQTIKLHQDANVYVSECDSGHTIDIQLGQGRQAYLVCMEGSMVVNDVQLERHDAAKIRSGLEASTPLTLTAGKQGSHFMLIEMARA